MDVHGELEARPKQHVCAVDVAIRDRDLSALELKSETLVQANAKEDTEAVIGSLDKGFGKSVAQRKSRGENC